MSQQEGKWSWEEKPSNSYKPWLFNFINTIENYLGLLGLMLDENLMQIILNFTIPMAFLILKITFCFKSIMYMDIKRRSKYN
jgi:hypothetical protein